MKALILAGSLLVAAGGAQAATTLYDNGPADTSGISYTINGPFEVADSFGISSAATASLVDFVTATNSGDPLTSIHWAIFTSNPFAGGATSIASGVADPLSSSMLAENDSNHVALWSDQISIGSVSLTSGTYWLEFSGAQDASGGTIYWNANSGSSSAFQGPSGDAIPSESFAIIGAASSTSGGGTVGGGAPSGVPEPATWALMLAGFASLGLAMRSRRETLARA